MTNQRPDCLDLLGLRAWHRWRDFVERQIHHFVRGLSLRIIAKGKDRKETKAPDCQSDEDHRRIKRVVVTALTIINSP